MKGGTGKGERQKESDLRWGGRESSELLSGSFPQVRGKSGQTIGYSDVSGTSLTVMAEGVYCKSRLTIGGGGEKKTGSAGKKKTGRTGGGRVYCSFYLYPTSKSRAARGNQSSDAKKIEGVGGAINRRATRTASLKDGAKEMGLRLEPGHSWRKRTTAPLVEEWSGSD